MPNNREWAMFAWFCVLVGGLVCTRTGRSSVKALLKAFVQPLVVIIIGLFIVWVSVELWASYEIGLWRPDLATDFVMWILVSGFVTYFNFDKVSKQQNYLRRCILQTVGIAEVLQFLTNLFPFSLIVELILVPAASLLVLLAAVAGRDDRNQQVKKLLQQVQVFIGIVLLAFFLQQLIANWNSTDWQNVGRKFALPIALTVGLIPLVYTVGIWACYEKIFKLMNWIARPGKPLLSAKIALVSGLHIRVRDVGTFRSPWTNRLLAASSFAGSKNVVSEFLESRRESERLVVEEQERLRRYAGSQETDPEGRRLDRREFNETIKTLEWLADCQMGWYHNDDRYRRDLLEVLGTSFLRRGLPEEDDIVMEISADEQAWYAWRRTITGWCFAIGASGPPPDQWKYDGSEPPNGFPGSGTQWADMLSSMGAPNWK